MIAILNLREQTSIHEMGGSAPDCRFLLNNDLPDKSIEGKSSYIVNSKDVINVTGKCNADGKLIWSAPKGACLRRCFKIYFG